MRFLLLLALSLWTAVSAPAQAQDYPEKGRVIRIIVSYPPGAANDILARLVGQELQERWGTPVVVENRPGGNGMIGASLVAKSPPDGYTLWLGTDGPAAINLSLYRNVPYDPVKDFAPLSLLARYQLVLVVPPSLNVSSVQQFVELVRKKPDSIGYASPGIGSQHHLAMELLSARTGIKMLHVPYRGSAAAVTGLLSGDVQAQMQGTAVVQSFVQDGKMKALAVSSATRSPLLPDVPTIRESGVDGYEISVWFGLMAPAGTPGAIVQKLNKELISIVSVPAIREKMLVQGLEPATSTPEEFTAFIKSEIAKWADVVKTAKVQTIE
ncbi:MAG: tripartite tricarboxylate transporter substrate binding protein [Xanthobacteraceae bacterium]|nr:tripartite tricarboxylate transporter substrate binding protein [Xanthobacteraceae bacterium]